VIGIEILQTEYSIWFIMMIFFGALRWGFVKRYQEIQVGTASRQNLNKYNASFLEQIIWMLMTVMITTYSLYTFNSIQSQRMVLSLPVVIFCIIRFYYAIFFQKKYVESIENIILHDVYIRGSVIVYLLITIIVVSRKNFF
jgi:hypothetical protein